MVTASISFNPSIIALLLDNQRKTVSLLTTLLTPKVYGFSIPPSSSVLNKHQVGVLEFNSILAVTSQSYHKFSVGSVLYTLNHL